MFNFSKTCSENPGQVLHIFSSDRSKRSRSYLHGQPPIQMCLFQKQFRFLKVKDGFQPPGITRLCETPILSSSPPNPRVSVTNAFILCCYLLKSSQEKTPTMKQHETSATAQWSLKFLMRTVIFKLHF